MDALNGYKARKIGILSHKCYQGWEKGGGHSRRCRRNKSGAPDFFLKSVLVSILFFQAFLQKLTTRNKNDRVFSSFVSKILTRTFIHSFSTEIARYGLETESSSSEVRGPIFRSFKNKIFVGFILSVKCQLTVLVRMQKVLLG